MDDAPADPRLEEKPDDHLACMRAVSQVEACLDTQPSREGEWTDRLLVCLTRLSSTLRAHFAAEEQEPLFRTIPATMPRFADRLARLEAEHGRMLTAIDSVLEKAKGLPKERIYAQRALNGEVQLLVARIRRHEAEENEVLIEAHWDEVGGGD